MSDVFKFSEDQQLALKLIGVAGIFFSNYIHLRNFSGIG
jgi:hypothetical protein